MLVGNIFTVLGSKNTWNSGKYSLPLPLQHCNLQFSDISEIVASGKGEKGPQVFSNVLANSVTYGSVRSVARH